jgi:hypothetical protein
MATLGLIACTSSKAATGGKPGVEQAVSTTVDAYI